MSIAEGKAQEVPIPISTRLSISPTKVAENPPSSPPVITRAVPEVNTRRGPRSSATLPAAGWAMEVVM